MEKEACDCLNDCGDDARVVKGLVTPCDKWLALEKQCESTSTEYFDGRGNVTSTHFDREKFAKLIQASGLRERFFKRR